LQILPGLDRAASELAMAADLEEPVQFAIFGAAFVTGFIWIVWKLK
jgi:hypothetical protein